MGSGECLSNIMHYYKILPNEVLVVHDEMKLSFGEIILKFNGSCHGHNGIKDIKKKVGTDKFYKIKVGIGMPDHEMDNSTYVLKNFSKKEKEILSSKIEEISSLSQGKSLMQMINNMKR